MTAQMLLTEIQNCFRGFEDFKFNYESIEEVKPNEILVDGLVVTGTHTKEFKFANFPAIPATQRHTILDPERIFFHFEDGKIVKEEIVALGNLTGPPGMYVLVGGKLPTM